MTSELKNIFENVHREREKLETMFLDDMKQRPFSQEQVKDTLNTRS